MGYYPGDPRHLTSQSGGPDRPMTKNQKIGLVVGVSLLTGWAAASLLSGTAVGATIGTGVRYFGYARRPVLSYGVHRGIRGASTLMGVSKAYAITMLAHGIYELDKNIALARDKEYKRLGINLMGPPGSLWLYDKIYNGPAKESLPSSSTSSQQNGGGKGNKTSTRLQKSKLRLSSKSYKPKAGRKCAPGYRKVGGRCVKK